MRFTIAIHALIVGVLTAVAQTNTLWVPNVELPAGHTISLPINIDNTQDIVAAQFTLRVPTGLTIDPSTATITERAAGHSVTMRQMATGEYMAVVFAADNSPLTGRTGSVITVAMTADRSLADNTMLQLQLADVVLSAISGDNVATGHSAGTATIIPLPDLQTSLVVPSATTITPGQRLGVAWQVENIGGAPTKAGWSEQIYLKSTDGTDKLIGTLYYDNTLAAGASVSRQAELELPTLPGIDGEAQLRVKVTPNSDAGEPTWMLANNEATATEAITVERVLAIEPASTRIDEANTRVRLRLNRSGSTAQAQTFALEPSADSRAQWPTAVTIAQGQSGAYFNATITANGTLDDDSLATITASGNNYPEATATLTIDDDTDPALSLTASAQDVTEGGSLTLTITAQRAPKQDTEVELACDYPSRFNIPSPIVLGAGQTTTTAIVTAIDDTKPDIEQVVTFTANANGYVSAAMLTTLIDNDLPTLQLTLEPQAVSEAAGLTAVTAVLRRTSNIDTKVTINLKDNGNGGIFYSRQSVTMAEGQQEATVTLGPIDNALADGERTVDISAAVYIASCSCDATSGMAAGVVTAPLTIYDDDGPALKLVPQATAMGEGGSISISVERNSSTAEALAVELKSSHDEALSYPATVTIAAGKASEAFTVSTAANQTVGDGFMATLTAAASGHSGATTWFNVTDQTLPDAQITALQVSANEALPGDTINATFTVENTGTAPLPTLTTVALYAGTGSTPATIAYLQEPLAAGASVVMSRNVALPTAVGTHQVYAVANHGRQVKELIYTNNSSPVAQVSALSPFALSVSVDKEVYQVGERVEISGHATGQNIEGKQVEVYVINGNYRHAINATIEANGAFAATYQPYERQVGLFTVGACYPGEDKREAMASFNINALQLGGNGYIKADVTVGHTFTGSIAIANPGSLPITGIKATATGMPEGCDLQLNCPSTLGGGEQAEMAFTINGSVPTAGNNWQQIAVTVEADNANTASTIIYYYCRNNRGQLQASVQNINTTMVKGQSRNYPIVIKNIGGGETGTITLALPQSGWMTTATPAQMPSLAPGEEATIMLLLTPNENQQLNVPVTGRLGINCANGNGLPIAYSITPVSESKGTLVVDVCDEHTYYTAEGPHVAGAIVTIMDINTGAVVTSGTTGNDGLLTVELNEGYYDMKVTAPKHDPEQLTVLVDPGVETVKVVNLSYQGVQISYELEETEIEDEYTIVTNVTFETNVPKPVVVIYGPDRIDGDAMAAGEQTLVLFTLTNHGLMRSDNVQFHVPEATDEWLFEPLAYTEPFALAANQSVQIPVLITHYPNTTHAAQAKRRTSDPYSPQNIMNACMAHMEATYKALCGTELKDNKAAFRMSMKACASSALMNGLMQSLGGGIGGDAGFSGNGGGNGPASPNTPPRNDVSSSETQQPVQSSNDKTICNPCYAELMEKQLNKLLDLTPLRYFNDAANIAFAHVVDTVPYGPALARQILNYALEGVEDIVGDGPGSVKELLQEQFDNVKGELDNINNELEQFAKCQNGEGNEDQSTGNSSIDKMRKFTEEYSKELEHARNILFELLGDDCWLKNYAEDAEKLWERINEAYETYQEIVKPQSKRLTTRANAPLLDIDALMPYKPDGVTEEQLRTLVERLNGTSETNRPNPDVLMANADSIIATEQMAIDQGYDSMTDLFYDVYNEFLTNTEYESSSICSSISLSFEQSMVMTRQAFRGTLTVYNGNDEGQLGNVLLSLRVADTEGNVATTQKMQISLETISGFEGEAALGSGWTLAPKETGRATILYIPTKHAAPTEPVDYVFSGTLTYLDPYTGYEVTRDIYPVTLTVNPSPTLNMTYFMQRDVLGDDPLTDVVEPSVEAEFALLIDNVGHGDAKNVRMVTQQPQIIDNEKGTLLDITIESAQLNGSDKALALGGSIATDFGNIAAGSQTYAQWWMKSSLLGHFTTYNVEATHVTSYGNADLSLLGEVSVHELIRSLDASNGDTTRLVGFMVNDIVDANDTPDMLYLSNGTVESVAEAQSANVAHNAADNTCTITIVPSKPGWNYISTPDPTYGTAQLVAASRQGDGLAISMRNVWQTDRTLRDGREPLYENRIHVADYFATAEPQTYLLDFEPSPRVRLEVTQIEGMPTDQVATAPVASVTVTFNKAINPATFTSDDVTLAVEGVVRDASAVAISTADNTTFTLDLTATDSYADNGYHSLTVQTAGITDAEGYAGQVGKTVGWTAYGGGTVALLASSMPADGGYIAMATNVGDPLPAEAHAAYGATLRLRAVPAKGYRMESWTVNGETRHNGDSLTLSATGDMNIVANFALAQHSLSIAATEGGTVEGTAAGIYSYGQAVALSAMASDDYVFDFWVVNDDTLSTNSPTLDTTLTGDTEVKAVFQRTTFHQRISLQQGWNWISSYVSKPIATSNLAYATRIVGQSAIGSQDVGDADLATDSLLAGRGYKVHTNIPFVVNVSGPMLNTLTQPIELQPGWNWVAYPFTEAGMTSNVITNASEGDVVASQASFAEYADGQWHGTLTAMEPGNAYLYKTAVAKRLDMTDGSGTAATLPTGDSRVNMRAHQSAMYVTATVLRDGQPLNADEWCLVATVGDECRGIGMVVNGLHYITISGQTGANEALTLTLENSLTGESLTIAEQPTFADNTAGSRKAPLTLNVSGTNNISQLLGAIGNNAAIHTIEGVLVAREATPQVLERLPRGVYIIGHRKYVVK